MAKFTVSGSLFLAFMCATCLISIFPSTLASFGTSVPTNVVFSEKPEEGNSTGGRQSAQSDVMGTVVTIWTKPNYGGTSRRQRAVAGCENLASPFQSNVLSIRIEWNVKDSYPVHSMCKAVYFWTEANCYGYGVYWTVPGGTANPTKYDYTTYYYPQLTGVYTKIKSIKCDLGTVATPSPPPPQTSGDSGCLAPHNSARSSVGVAGLVWDTNLVASAQRWANTLRDNSCGFYHSGGSYGENLYKMWGAVPTCNMAVTSWVNERADYNYNSNSCASGKQCGHYTQIVWRNSKRVGCARSTCSVQDNIYIWVCHYDPPGNYVGQRPY